MVMKRVKYCFLIFTLSFLFISELHAQAVYAQVSSKRVQTGTPFEYAIVISVTANNYSPPSFKDFDVVSGPNQSSSVQYANGSMSQQLIISYGLVAKKEGKFTIGPATVSSGSQRYETSSIQVEVVKSTAGDSPDGRPGGGDVFIKTSISKTKCFLGEQITIIQKVYSRHQIIGYQRSVPPAYDGFYSQAQESPTKGQLVMENVDGINYYTHELFRTVASPNKTGKITLTPVEAVPIIRRQSAARSRNFLDQFFGGASYEDLPVTVSSRPTIVEVLPLPVEGRPENFSGAVGSFSSRIETSRQELKANEAFNLKITITGRGNLKLLSPPKFELPESFESYEPKITETGNSKSFDYLVIPRSEGVFTLDNLGFSYFDLDSKKYVTLPSGDIKIQVLAPDPDAAGARVYHPQNQVKETENDIRYIKKGDILLSRTSSEFFNSPAHLISLSVIILLLGGGLVLRRNHIRNNSNVILVKERKAAGVARKQLVTAEKQIAANNKDAFYIEILNALNNYLSYKLNLPVADLSRDRVSETLSKRSVSPETSAKLLETISVSEYARYAPGAVSGDLRTVYNDTVHLITALEQQLNKKP